MFNVTSQSRQGDFGVLTQKDFNLDICPADCRWNDRYTESRYKDDFESAVPNNFAAKKKAQEYNSNIFNRPDVSTALVSKNLRNI